MRSRAITVLRPFRTALPGWRQPLCAQQQYRSQSQIVRLRNGNELRRQDVYIKRMPVFSWRRLMTLCIYGFTVYYTLKYVPRLTGYELSVELDYDEEEGQEDEEGRQSRPKRLEEGVQLTEEDLEADEDSLFIPMTWAEKLPRKFYKGSDPEWQEFIKVSKNPARAREIMQQMLDSFMAIVSKHPGVVRSLGSDIKRGKHWLDVTFPEGPPQEYVRSGIEIGDGYIAWSRERITAEKQRRLSNVLWPTALLDSVAAFWKTLGKMQFRQVLDAMGYPSGTNEFDQQIKAMEAMMARAGERAGKTLSESTSVTSSSTISSNTSEPSESVSKALWPLPSMTLPLKKTAATDSAREGDIKMAVATHVFARTLTKKLAPKGLECPRGTFVVHGLIEVRGKVGRMLFDVVGVYDPKQSRYVRMDAALKHFKKAKQSPRGGD